MGSVVVVRVSSSGEQDKVDEINSKTRSSFFIVLVLRYLNIPIIYNPINHTNKCKSSLTSLVACFILGKVYCRTYRRWYAFGLKENPSELTKGFSTY